MIGFGIDAVEIHRFTHWHAFQKAQLQRIFSPQEIDHCLAHSIKSAERFAVRFAAKEAFFKAWNSAFAHDYIPFLTLCRAISIQHDTHHRPHLAIDWNLLPIKYPTLIPLISLTHTNTTAIACIFLKNIQSETSKP